MSYIKKFIRASNRNTFIAVVKDLLITDFDIIADKDGDLSTGELAISDDEICVATMINDDAELELFYVDGRSRERKIKVLFSTEYLADEMLGQRL